MFEEYTDAELMAMAGDTYSDEELRQIAGPDYVQDIGPVQASVISAGKTMTDIGRGVENLYYKATGDEAGQAELAAEAAREEAIYAPLTDEYPIATGVGEATPYLATAPLSGGLLTQMAIGGVAGSLEYDQDQGMGALEGAAYSGIGYGLGTVGGRVLRAISAKGKQATQATSRTVSRVASKVSREVTGLDDVLNVNAAYKVSDSLGDEAQRLASRAEDIGIRITPAQKSGKSSMRILEASAKSNPMTSSLFDEIGTNNQRVINKLAAKSIGETGDEVTPMMLGNAAERIGQVYDDAANAVGKFNLDEDAILSVMDDISVDGQRYLDNYIKRFPGFNKGVMTGEEFMRLRNVIAKDMRSAWRNNPGVTDDLADIQDIMHEAIQRTAPDQAARLRIASKQWKNLKALETGKTVTKGNVNPASLDTRLRRLDKSGYLRGKDTSDYYDAIRAANQFGDSVGNSGTAERSFLSNMMSSPVRTAATYSTARPVLNQYLKGSGEVMGELLESSPAAERSGAVIGRIMAGEE